MGRVTFDTAKWGLIGGSLTCPCSRFVVFTKVEVVISISDGGRDRQGRMRPGRHFAGSSNSDSTFQKFSKQYILPARVSKVGIQM